MLDNRRGRKPSAACAAWDPMPKALDFAHLSPHRHQDRLVAAGRGAAGARARCGRGLRLHTALARDIADFANTGRDILVVTSGAIALGRGVLGLPGGTLRLEEGQAAAAVGQIALARAWSEVLSEVGLTAGQILLTPSDTEERRRYLNARSTIATLLKLRSIPVINENDTVATSEIRYGDNDRLAARVASMMSADLLVLLSDISGLYTAPPLSDPNARLIETVERITPAIEAMAGDAASDQARGGMRTKIEAGKIATAAGATMVIASGAAACRSSAPAHRRRRALHLVPGAHQSGHRPQALDLRHVGDARLAGGGRRRGERAALRQEPAAGRGARRPRRIPSRRRGAHHRRRRPGDRPRPGVAYDTGDAERIAGRNSRQIETILGFAGRAEMIHRDDMALRGE